MALNSLGLGFVFTAKDLASGTMRKLERRFSSLDATSSAAASSFKRNVGTMVAGLGMMAVGAVGVGAALNLAGKFGTFEKGLAKVGAITSASTKDMALLKETAIQAGINTQFSPDEAVSGLAELGVRGFNATQSVSALGGALDLAAGGEISVAQSAATMSAALRVFGKDASDATEVADKLLKISTVTALGANELESALGSVARGAISGKQGIDEMLISVGLVRMAGVEASKSANAVSSAMQFMGKNGDEFKKIGVPLDDVNGKMRDYLDIVQDTGIKLDGLGLKGSERLAKEVELFGRFGQLGFSATLVQLEHGVEKLDGTIVKGAEAVRYLRDNMNAAAGTAATFREKILDTFEGQKILLKGSMQTLGVVMGEAFAQVFKPIVSGVITGVNALIAVIKDTPGPIKRFVGGLLIVVSTLLFITGAVIAAVSAFSLISMAVAAFAPALIIAAKVIGIVALAALALVTVFAIVKTAYDRNIGGLGDKLRAVGAKVTLFFDAVKQLLSGNGLRGEVLKSLLDPMNAGVLSMVQRFQQLRFRITRFFGGLKEGFDDVMYAAGPTFSALGSAVEELFAALGFGSKALGLFTGKSQDWADTGKTIGTIVGDLARILISGLTLAINMATGAIEGMKTMWLVIRPILYVAWVLFRALSFVIGVVASILGDTTEASSKAGGTFDHMAKMVGAGIVIFYGLKGALYAARGAMIAYEVAQKAVTAAQAAYAALTATTTLAMSGGLVGAALLVGVALGELANSYGADEGLANFLLDITGVTAELEKLDAAYRKTVARRGEIAMFAGTEEAAKAAGMTTGEFIQKRSSEIAGSGTAQQLGLSQGEIARRLQAGEDVFKELKSPADAADGGIAANANGEANKAKAQQQMTAEAIRMGLTRAEKENRPVKFVANLKMDSQTLATVVKDAERASESMDFEADLSMAGGS